MDDNPTLFNSLYSDSNQELFDIIISNPPYFKISKDDPRARAAARIVYGNRISTLYLWQFPHVY